MAKPFLRWAGGKSWLVKYLKGINNTSFQNYHEPFLGGGATFFFIQPQGHSFLSDLNEDLIETYNAIKNNAPAVIRAMKSFKNTEKEYYSIREQQFRSTYQRAAKFIYLNQTSYNGIYRVNLQGKYNVPYCFRKKNFLDSENLMNVQEALKNTTIEKRDFYTLIDYVKKNEETLLKIGEEI